MGKHVDAGGIGDTDAAITVIDAAVEDVVEQADSQPGDEIEPAANDAESADRGADRHRPGGWKRVRRPSSLVAVAAVLVVALGALGGWLGYQVHAERQSVAGRAMFVEAARQGVVNLTTIGYATIDADIVRVLDSSTGGFHDDFQKRSQPFATFVRQAQSKTRGTVTNAALESQDGDRAQVLVNVSMQMSSPAAPDEPPRAWRMRISVDKVGDIGKISDVQFVA